MDGNGTQDDPWQLTTAPGSSSYTMYKDESADHGDWMPLGAADEKKPAAEGSVEG